MALSDYVCGRCGHGFCEECVVFPHGLGHPPMCIACALEAGGVRRQHTGRPKLPRREVRRRLALAEAEAAAAAAETAPVPTGGAADDAAAEEQRWLDGQAGVEEFGGWSESY